MTEVTYNTINSLGEIGIIAGDERDLVYNIYDSGGNLLDLSRFSSFHWLIAYYDQPDYLMGSVTPTITGTGELTVSLDYYTTMVSTMPISGKFAYQLRLTNYDGEIFIYQGILYILPHPNE